MSATRNFQGSLGSLICLAPAILICLFFSSMISEPVRADNASQLGLELPKSGIPDRVGITRKISSGKSVVVAELDGPGCIRHLWMTLSKPWNNYSLVNRKSIIRIYFDDAIEPQVEAPLGDFFGVMHGVDFYNINCQFLSAKERSGYNCYFPMPFAKNARIELETSETDQKVYAQVDWTRYKPSDFHETQRFCARWRRENPTERYSKGFQMLDADGPGRLIGFVYGVRLFDNVDRWSHGGAENIYLDGESDNPAFVRGIGGEDTFGTSYGGALHVPESHLFAGMPYYTLEDIGEARPAQRLVGYRFFVEDPITFQNSIHMQFGCMQNDICATVYWYQSKAPRAFVKTPKWKHLLPDHKVAREDMDLELPNSGQWQLTGVFEKDNGDPSQAIDRSAEKAKPEDWRDFDSLHGFVDFGHRFRPHEKGVGKFYEDVAAVARTTIDAPDATEADLLFGWDDELVVRVNDGEPINLGKNTAFRSKSIAASLNRGINTITVANSNTRGTNHGGWVFSFRAKTEDGKILNPQIESRD
jgi:hypothetical protein